MIWWILPIAVGILGLVLVVSGMGRIAGKRLFSGGSRFLIGGATLAGAGVLSLAGLNLQTYARLTAERDVAKIELAQTGAQEFEATVTFAQNTGALGRGGPRSYTIRGDEIRLEARILKWKPWANVLGRDALFRLGRLSGRYAKDADELAGERTVIGLTDDAGIDVWNLVDKQGQWQNAVDAVYGNGVFVPMADGAVYYIKMTQSGLIARAPDDMTREALSAWE